jgi:kynurenine 3-monooxygenase
MKGHVNNAMFREKRNLEMAFEKQFPNEYSSKYSMVTFNEEMGYHQAMTRGRAQDKAILNMLADKEIDLKDDLKINLEKIKAATEEILDVDRVAKNFKH